MTEVRVVKAYWGDPYFKDLQESLSELYAQGFKVVHFVQAEGKLTAVLEREL